MYKDEQDQPILEPAPGEFRLWDNIRLIGLFDPSISNTEIVTRCEQALGRDLPQFQLEQLAEQDWERSWMDGFQPMQFGPSLWVCPWHIEVPDPDAVNIRLDPGLAFGTGTHATTAQCLQWLGRNRVTDAVVVDYGCGSGVLAVAASLLGAREVIAVDIDPQALLATEQNAERNGVPVDGKHFTVLHPDQFGSRFGGREFDLVIANILFTPLVELAPFFARLLKPDASLVMSGVLESQVNSLMLHYTQWFGFGKPSATEGWALLEATRRAV